LATDLPTPEFSRVQRLDALGTDKTIRLSAKAAECAALASRFELVSIKHLNAELTLTAQANAILMAGHLSAQVTQSCVATGEPVMTPVRSDFTVRFIGADAVQDDAELEIDAEDCDEMVHDGQSIDLGEAVAQSLVLALDPWPRHPQADAILKASGAMKGEDVGPFAALKALKDKMGE
jgi:uncharacterized metal-binding protein YceD (DUF177 family)